LLFVPQVCAKTHQTNTSIVLEKEALPVIWSKVILYIQGVAQINLIVADFANTLVVELVVLSVLRATKLFVVPADTLSTNHTYRVVSSIACPII